MASPKQLLTIGLFAALLLIPGAALAQRDPGPRPGPPGAGGPIDGLSAAELLFFQQAQDVFQEVDSVSGTLPGEPGKGLGPVFNGNSCAMCHAQPSVGGSSPGLLSPQRPVPNPQVALATLDGARNVVPSFITPNGPVREARLIATSLQFLAPNDGNVVDVFTIAGRVDAPGCTLPQPDFATQIAGGNIIFRIPTPTFGVGLVENVDDSTLIANLNATSAQRAAVGILGEFNRSGNDGTITRFGWKAQNKSGEIFAGEAYNVEQGVTNELFQNERVDRPLSCRFNPLPEDHTNFTNPNDASPNFGTTIGTASEMASDVVNFAGFMRFLAPPTPAPLTASAANGKSLFNTVGCALCHSPNLTTAPSSLTPGLSSVTFHPYSDFALHHMGNLADGILQGLAGPDEFRTAPLWGVGQRLFFLHDGRTTDLLQAIQAHFTPVQTCVQFQSFAQFTVNGKAFQPQVFQQFCGGSEANLVINRFNALGVSQKQDILNFLRSL